VAQDHNPNLLDPTSTAPLLRQNTTLQRNTINPRGSGPHPAKIRSSASTTQRKTIDAPANGRLKNANTSKTPQAAAPPPTRPLSHQSNTRRSGRVVQVPQPLSQPLHSLKYSRRSARRFGFSNLSANLTIASNTQGARAGRFGSGRVVTVPNVGGAELVWHGYISRVCLAWENALVSPRPRDLQTRRTAGPEPPGPSTVSKHQPKLHRVANHS